ncbi:hypothetical protein LguiA_001796 [Lonicera macranthoides]
MEGRKWEDMEMDCLVNIFGRVGTGSLVFGVAFVCKSWNKATLNPLCWQSLMFPKDLEDSRFPWFIDLEGLLKGAVNRSQRSATRLALPDNCSNEDIIYALEECPLLKLLSIPYSAIYNRGGFIIPSMINKLKNLETLMIPFSLDLEEIIAQIKLHCKNFIDISVTNAKISSDAAIAIATLLPNIKGLSLRRCELERSDLVIILNGCKKLEYMDVSICIAYIFVNGIKLKECNLKQMKYFGREKTICHDQQCSHPKNYLCGCYWRSQERVALYLAQEQHKFEYVKGTLFLDEVKWEPVQQGTMVSKLFEGQTLKVSKEVVDQMKNGDQRHLFLY